MLQRTSFLKLFTLAIVTLLSITYFTATAQTSTDTSIVGMWQGALEVGGTKLRIVFHVVKTDGGKFVSTMDSPDQGATGILVSSTTVSGDSVVFAIASIGGLYKGSISSDKSSIKGKWSQGGASLDLPLNRTSPAVETAQTSTDTSIVGMWQGTLEIGRMKLRIVFHVVKTDGGKFVTTQDSPDQGAKGIPVSSTLINGDSVVFIVAVIRGSYKGSISDDKSSIEGKWSQGGASLNLRLTRTTAEIKFNRPQEPKPPFSYKAEDVSYENTIQKVKLAGTLTTPGSGGPFPAVILITGSGAQNRNEELLGHKPFLVIADYLTRRGIAVLRVDDRGVGGSTGSTKNSTTADFGTDVLAGMSFLKNRGDINAHKIGLIGHSEGGIIAPLVASQSKDVAFIVTLAGTGLSGEDILQMQTRLIEEADSTPADKIAQDVAHIDKICSILKSGKDSIAITDQLNAYLKSTLSEWGADLLKSGMNPEEAINTQINIFNSPWFRYFVTYDPRPALKKVKCPALAMNGALDLQVPPKENLKEIEKALRAGGNKNVTIKLMPGLNHLFQNAKTGSPKEYAQIEETFSPVALKVIGDWIVENTDRK